MRYGTRSSHKCQLELAVRSRQRWQLGGGLRASEDNPASRNVGGTYGGYRFFHQSAYAGFGGIQRIRSVYERPWLDGLGPNTTGAGSATSALRCAILPVNEEPA